MAVAIGQPPQRKSLRTHPVLAESIVLVAAAIVVSLLAMLLLPGDTPAPAEPAMVAVSEPDAGSTVRLNAGDRLQVELEGNPSTGYTWEVTARDTAVLTLVGDQEFVPDSGALGSGGRVVTRFEATGAGQSALQMIYHRSFETNAAPLKTFELRVVVEQ
jgi:inhibitor of cysteine peptidase